MVRHALGTIKTFYDAVTAAYYRHVAIKTHLAQDSAATPDTPDRGVRSVRRVRSVRHLTRGSRTFGGQLREMWTEPGLWWDTGTGGAWREMTLLLLSLGRGFNKLQVNC